jgi:MFS family permease
MDDMWVRFTTQLIDRVSGPMQFRLVLQPLMATFFAIRSGLADAPTDRPPYFWGLFSDRVNRRAMLKDGWRSISRVFVFAIVLDVIYQLYVLHFVYPGEAIVVALILAIVPYLILRGIVTRVARAMGRGASTHTPGTRRHA